MPGISRNRIDLARTGHACTTAIGCIATARTVFANARTVLRPGDRLLPHTILRRCGPTFCCVGHRAKVKRGSPNVFIRNKPVARRGDSADFGKMLRGSRNVFANGGGGRL
jgi:uncharacterized Zn-binding protein involved in type VI secretion